MKGRYQVHHGSSLDPSFRNCVCTMLVLLALFLLISVVLWTKQLMGHKKESLLEEPDPGDMGSNSHHSPEHQHRQVSPTKKATTVAVQTSDTSTKSATTDAVKTSDISTKSAPISNTSKNRGFSGDFIPFGNIEPDDSTTNQTTVVNEVGIPITTFKPPQKQHVKTKHEYNPGQTSTTTHSVEGEMGLTTSQELVTTTTVTNENKLALNGLMEYETTPSSTENTKSYGSSLSSSNKIDGYEVNTKTESTETMSEDILNSEHSNIFSEAISTEVQTESGTSEKLQTNPGDSDGGSSSKLLVDRRYKTDPDDFESSTTTNESFTPTSSLADTIGTSPTGSTVTEATTVPTTLLTLELTASRSPVGTSPTGSTVTEATTVPTTLTTRELTAPWSPVGTSLTGSTVTEATTVTTREVTAPRSPDCPVAITDHPATAIPPDVCQSRQCHTLASRLYSLLDVNADPCEDFYSYACGGLLNNPTLLEEDPSVDVWNRINKAIRNVSSQSPASHKKLKSYYDGCVNYDQLVKMEDRKIEGRKVLAGIGQFVNATSDLDYDVTDILIKLFQHGSSPLFDLQLDVDASNSANFQMVITPPNWSSHFLSAEEKSQRCRQTFEISHSFGDDLNTNYEAYKKCLGNISDFINTTQKALEFFEVFDDMPTYNASQFTQHILMSLELNFLELLQVFPTPDKFQLAIQKKDFKPISLSLLENSLPQVDWRRMFRSLFNVEEVDEATSVQMYFFDSVKKFIVDFISGGEREAYNSLLAIFAHNLYTDIMQTHKPCDRERYCLRVAASLMPVVTSNMYLATFPANITKELKNQVNKMNIILNLAMKNKLDASEKWMDKKTMDEIRYKLESMSIQMPTMANDSLLNDSLGDCLMGSKQYLKDSICLLQQFQAQVYSRYKLEPRLSYVMWPHFLTSFSTKTAFIYGINTFMVPLAVVAPFSDQEMPRHVAMARLGNVVARGFGHNFDWTGVMFASSGKIGKVLSEASHPSYEEVVYNSNVIFGNEKKSLQQDGRTYYYKPNAELSLNQRLADITAANLSLSVLLTKPDKVLPWLPLTSSRVYFITLAQTLCSKKKIDDIFTTLFEGTTLPPIYRISNIVQNSEQFALAFSCLEGSKMNPSSESKTRPFPMFEMIEKSESPFMTSDS